MKKIQLLLIAGLAFIGSATAQDGVMFGAKAGVNFANIAADEDANLDNYGGLDDDNTLTSFHVGLTADVKMTEDFGLGAEALYSRQGAKYDNALADGEIKLDYISIPILAKFYPSEAFNIYAGVQPSFLVSAERDGEVLGFLETQTDLKDADVVKDSDFSVPVGIGYRLENGVALDARYNIGTTDVFEDYSDAKNRVFQLSVGFNF